MKIKTGMTPEDEQKNNLYSRLGRLENGQLSIEKKMDKVIDKLDNLEIKFIPRQEMQSIIDDVKHNHEHYKEIEDRKIPKMQEKISVINDRVNKIYIIGSVALGIITFFADQIKSFISNVF